MRSTDLETLYTKIDGHILLVAAFTGDQELRKIIKSCRLKPYSVFTGDFQPGTRFEKHWVDEFGNSLLFDGTSTKIVMNHTKLVSNTKISTDLFFGNSIRTIAKNSQFAMIASGKYISTDFHLIAFYGKDEYLRVFAFNGKWGRVSPLLLGMNTLHEFFKQINNPWITEIDKKKLDFTLRFDVEKCITTSLPPRQNITSCFDNETIINNIL